MLFVSCCIQSVGQAIPIHTNVLICFVMDEENSVIRIEKDELNWTGGERHVTSLFHNMNILSRNFRFCRTGGMIIVVCCIKGEADYLLSF